MQSQYHNLPQVNGFDQHEGRTYAAKNVKYSPGCLSMDLAGTYPAEAGIKKWLRTVRIAEKKQKGKGKAQAEVTVTDRYTLNTLTAPTRWMLIAAVKPQCTAPGTISLGSCTLHHHPSLNVTVEPLLPLMDSHLQLRWPDGLYRIVLTCPADLQKENGNWEIKVSAVR